MAEATTGTVGSRGLARQLGISVRTLRIWQHHGILPRGEGRRRARFDERSLVRGLAAKALRKVGYSVKLTGVHLADKSEDELRGLAGLGPPLPPPTPPIAPGDPAPAPSAPTTTTSSVVAAPPAPLEPTTIVATSIAPVTPLELAPPGGADVGPVPFATAPVEPPVPPSPGFPTGSARGASWRHIELMPGLVLMVRDDAPAFVHGLAETIASGRLA